MIPPSLIARYRCYGGDNNAADRGVLKDLSGNGNDITLNNFAWTEQSGYNKSDYKGALVFDGVDDYGLCDTFPVLNKEDGFTVIALRKWIGDMQNSACLCAIGTGDRDWASKHAAVLEYKEGTTYYNRSFGAIIHNTSDYWADGSFVYMTSKSYNGELDFSTVTRTVQVDPTLKLGMLYKEAQKTPFALYALEVYSRDLSEDEINRVRDRLMEEYLRETNCLDGLEYVAEWQTYGKTNTDEDRDVLKDLSGNGHDITLYNFDFTEQSGYNTTDYKGALVTDGVDDYGRTTAIDDEVGTMLSRLVPFATPGQRYYLNTSSYDSATSPYRLYIWNSVKDTPSISQGIKDDSGYVDDVWPYLSLVREPVSLGGRHLCLSSSAGPYSPASMAFYHLILIRQKCTVEQVDCLKWLMDKKYRDYLKNN